MRSIMFTLLFVLLPIFLFSQNNNGFKNKIGIDLSYSGISGLNAELNFKRSFANNYLGGIRVFSNGHDDFGIGLGVSRMYNVKRINLSLGLDIVYEKYFGNLLPNPDNKSNVFNLEVPLILGINLNKRISLEGGFAPSLNVNGVNSHTIFFDNPKIGLRLLI